MVEHLNTGTGERHTYSYDALGRRTRRVVDADGIDDGPLETWYLYSGRQVVEEQNPAGATQATYVNGVSSYILDDTKGSEIIRNSITLESSAEELFPLSPISMHRDDQDYYYHRDDIGSVTAVTDSTDKIVERYRYADYGSPTIFSQGGAVQEGSTIGNSLMFRDMRYDQETGLYSIYFDRSLNLTLDTTVWTKSFDPEAGRFIQRHGGDALGNHYTAFGNNPGRDQALSIIGTVMWLNRPSSPGYVDKACTPFAAGGPILDFAINGNTPGTAIAAGGGLGIWDDTDIVHLAPAHISLPPSGTTNLTIDGGCSGILDDGVTLSLVNGGKSPISSITIRANRLNIPGIVMDTRQHGISSAIWGSIITNGGQSLSGSGLWFDWEWIVGFSVGGGGGSGILGPRINSYWQGEGLLRPKPESWDNADGDIDLAPPAGEDVLGLWGEVTWVGCLRAGEVPRFCGDLDASADIDIGGFYFYPGLNFTDFILGDGF